jgi:hypothetical protein
MARPSKYTPECVKKILEAIRLGATYRIACQYAGINEVTFERWRASKVDFADNIREAEGVGAIKWLAQIEKAGNDGDWKALSWKLERRFPQEYGRTVQEVQGKDGGPIEVADVSDARARLTGRLDELAARRATRGVASPTHQTGS